MSKIYRIVHVKEEVNVNWPATMQCRHYIGLLNGCANVFPSYHSFADGAQHPKSKGENHGCRRGGEVCLYLGGVRSASGTGVARRVVESRLY